MAATQDDGRLQGTAAANTAFTGIGTVITGLFDNVATAGYAVRHLPWNAE